MIKKMLSSYCLFRKPVAYLIYKERDAKR